MIADRLEIAGLEGGTVNLSSEQIEALAARLGGRLLRPGDDGWEQAVLIWNGMVARQPVLVAQARSTRDVVEVIRFAREHRLLLSVKGGGHNIAGTALAERGLTLDLSQLRDISVDPQARLAQVGPGCQLRDVDRATQAHGLATVLGFVSEVGVAGLTLGGGLGYLTRRFGWTVDNLEAVEIVTADGQIRIASREQHPDLFWAVRGGGGNFGVVTRFSFQLHEVGPQVYGGLIAWPFERAGEILQAYRAITAGAPRELSIWLILLRAPAAPFVPEVWHDRRICAMAVCYSGELDRVEEVLAPVRALPDPILDLLGEQPYTRVQSYLDETEPAGNHYYWKTIYLTELGDELLRVGRELFAECPIPGGEVGILHLGGALNERPADDGAVGNRDVHYVVGLKGMWEPGEPKATAFRDWIQRADNQLQPLSTGRTYINFQTADEGESGVRATYGANLARLARIKARYDPDNLFRVNRNIQPAS